MSDVWSGLVGQDETVAVLQLAAAAAAQVAAGESVAGRRDESRLAVHRPGRLGPIGRRARARGRAAMHRPIGHPGCGECSACHTVLAGTHPDVRLVVPEGLSISVADIRGVVATAARLPALGRWQVVVIEDADRMTEGASNALLKAIEEPPARTVFLLCAPSTHPDDVSVTVRSRCRLVSLRTPPADAVAAVLIARRRRRRRPRPGRRAPRKAMSDGRGDSPATTRPDRGAADVLAIPASLRTLGACVAGGRPAGAIGREPRRPSITAELDADETQALQTALGAGATGRGTATAVRGSAGVVKDLEKRQRSRATRTQRDALDRALVDLAAFYRDVVLVQAGAAGPFAHPDFDDEVRAVAHALPPAGRAAVPRRGPRLPAGARAEREADHRGAGA